MAGWIWMILSALVFLQFFQRLLSRNKRLPPGPIGFPVIGHLHLLGKNPHQDLCHLARKHGPIMYMRFGSVPTVVVSSPAGAELVLKTHDLVFASRPPMLAAKYLAYDRRNIGFAPYGPYWRDMRKLCTLKLLSNHKITQFQSMRKAEVGLLIRELKRAGGGGEIVDVSAGVMALTRDMICLMVFGRKFVDSDIYEKGFEAVALETTELSTAFNVGDYFPLLGGIDVQGLRRRMKDLRVIYDGFVDKIIDDHIRNKDQKKEAEDFVDTMMSILESGEAGFEFDRRHVKAVLMDMLLAGMDSSSLTVDWALAELIRHPSALKKLREELETLVGMGHMVEESHLDKLEYLNAVVKETLRLHPVAPLLVPHESMEDCTLDGFYIPKNSRILVNVWAIGRDPNVWPNPESFSPERFIGSNIDVKGHDFQLLPFGSGRRGCPGLQLGLLVVNLVLAQLVHCFDWELPQCKLPTDLDMSEHFGLVVSRAQHLMAIPKYRLTVPF